jgi:Methyltransferase FkbM domain
MPTAPPGAELVALTRRWRHTRLVRAGAYRIGEALGDRVLVGKTLEGSRMALSMRDHQHRAIYFYGEYEPEITALFRRLVAPGSVVFDVGANAGYFSILSRELGATVHAFEPNPNVRALLSKSVSLGSGSGSSPSPSPGSGSGSSSGSVTVVAAACSDSAGTMPLYLSEPGNTGLTSLIARSERSVEVDVITLDEHAHSTRTRPSLVKIDVEGHEREVLAGAGNLLESVKPTVIAEVGGPETIELMEGHGYTPRRIMPDGSTAAHDGRLHAVGGYENICFLPPQEG